MQALLIVRATAESNVRSYRLARRSFLAAVGGAVGLKAILTHMEAAAQGATSPPRFLLTHFPIGTLRYRFLPQGTGADYVASPLIQPFEDAGLRGDMTVFYGFSDQHLTCPGGGGHEAGTLFTTTGCNAEGTRENGGESDDAVAGGPSFDQVFLENVPDLARDGVGYANAICDARVDSNETSTRCLSYGYATRSVASAVPGGTITEYTPLLPQLSPSKLYAELFSSFSPGGTNDANRAAALRALRMRKSVLDHSLAELKELERLAPASERLKIDMHAQAIRKVEEQLSAQLESGDAFDGTRCSLPPEPSGDLIGQEGNDTYRLDSDVDDTATHRAVAEAHLAILLAAFQCDIIRVATFQFCPGANHVSFKGMWPGDPERSVMYHPASHLSAFLAGAADKDPSYLSGIDREAYEFLANVQTWYNQRIADFLVKMKDAVDGFGGRLLDHTVIPYVTEVAAANSTRSPKPAYLFGGGALGLQHGTFQSFYASQEIRPQVDLFLTCAQALMQTDHPRGGLEAERFYGFNPDCAAFDNLWTA